MFKNNDVKIKVTGLLKSGLKAKAILSQLESGDCQDFDIYGLAHEMRQKGELTKAKGQGSHSGGVRRNRKRNPEASSVMSSRTTYALRRAA